MIGVVFWNSEKDSPVASISNDDEDPVTLRICERPGEIEMLVAECECVNLEDAQCWTFELREFIHKAPQV